MFIGFKGKVWDLTGSISEVAVREFVEKAHQPEGKIVDEQHFNIKFKKQQTSLLADKDEFDEQGDPDR